MPFDLLIKGATVYPGDGHELRADVGIAGECIAAVERSLPASNAAEVIDATGLILCPGFIDLHAHTALEPFRNPRLEPKVAQGFTTELINPDGLAPAPVAEDGREGRRAYLRPLEGPGPEIWPWSTFSEYLEALEQARPEDHDRQADEHDREQRQPGEHRVLPVGDRRPPVQGDRRRVHEQAQGEGQAQQGRENPSACGACSPASVRSSTLRPRGECSSPL